MTEMKMPLEDFLGQWDVGSELTHHGVKGQKWGVRKSRISGSGVNKSNLRKAALVGAASTVYRARELELRNTAATAGQVAWTAARIGVPTVLTATGVGVPITVGVGVTMRLLNEPEVRSAVSAAASYSSELIRNVGQVKVSEMFSPAATNPAIRKMDLPVDRPKGGVIFNPDAKIDRSQIEVRN